MTQVNTHTPPVSFRRAENLNNTTTVNCRFNNIHHNCKLLTYPTLSTMMKLYCILVIALLSVIQIDALAAPSSTRREAISAGWAAASLTFLTTIQPANAEENKVLSDEDMAARIALKKALKSGAARGSDAVPGAASDIRSDVNPAAAANLRARSLAENAQNSAEKQKEMKSRDKKQKREDMCEMLGRGC
jgi:hypothetical protein